MGRKSMKVKTTKTMARQIMLAVKDKGLENVIDGIYQESYEPISLFSDDGDYDSNTGQYFRLRVVYNPNMYAMPKELHTSDLNRCLRTSDKTLYGFMEEIIKEIEV